MLNIDIKLKIVVCGSAQCGYRDEGIWIMDNTKVSSSELIFSCYARHTLLGNKYLSLFQKILPSKFDASFFKLFI